MYRVGAQLDVCQTPRRRMLYDRSDDERVVLEVRRLRQGHIRVHLQSADLDLAVLAGQSDLDYRASLATETRTPRAQRKVPLAVH